MNYGPVTMSFEAAVTFVFIIDIVVYTRVAVLSNHCELIFDKKAILWYNIKHYWVWDFIGTFPFLLVLSVVSPDAITQRVFWLFRA
jgi:hypothetical protein